MGVVQPGEDKVMGPSSTYKVNIKKMKPGSLQQPMAGRGGNGHKLKQEQLQMEGKEKLFHHEDSQASTGPSCPEKLCSLSSLEVFMIRQDKVESNLV